MIKIHKECKLCKTSRTIEVKKDDYEKVQQGEHIQNAMPYLTADERELLISGICGTCFDEMFGDDD